jgi:hypothetical protein
MKRKMKEITREIAPGVEITLTGEDVQPDDAILAQVLLELAAEAGGKLRFDMSDHQVLEKILQRAEEKGLNLRTSHKTNENNSTLH